MSLIFITNRIKKYVRTSEFQLSREKIKKKQHWNNISKNLDIFVCNTGNVNSNIANKLKPTLLNYRNTQV